jgi:hypothetical protein
VLGPDAGAAYARRQGLAALFLVQRRDGVQAIVTPALRPLLVGPASTLTGG